MEVIYFFISILEIILTIFLCVSICKKNNEIINLQKMFDNNIETFYSNFRDVAHLFSSINKGFKTYNEYLAKMKEYEKYFKTFSHLKSIVLVLSFIFGMKSKGKFGFKKI